MEFANGIGAQSAAAGAGILGGAVGLGYAAKNYQTQSGLTTAAEGTAAAALLGGGAYVLHGQHKAGKDQHEANPDSVKLGGEHHTDFLIKRL